MSTINRSLEPRITRRTLAVVAGAAALLTLFAGLRPTPASAAAYPSPAPLFGHFDEPHSRLFSRLGGNQDRPMLVIYAQFADVRFPAGRDAEAIARRFFGPFPSVADYYDDDSSGHLLLSAAAEHNSWLGGSHDDGVVAVTLPSNKQTFNAQSAADEIKALLTAADPYVDFAAFDRSGDGRLTEDELVINRVDADPDPVTAGCGASRDAAAVTLDGTRLGGLKVAMGGTDTNLMTLIHETGHVAFDMPDTYFWDVGALDLGGATCQAEDSRLFRNSAYQKLHLDWTRPTVVTRDGHYVVDRTAAGGQGYLLYDPHKGQVAVRAIEAAGPGIRAYFDVRGPGVLVDTYPLNDGRPPHLVPGRANAISLPVMNTGEWSDSFSFTAIRLPPGWTTTSSTRRLGAGAASTATIEVIPPPTKGTVTQALRIMGRSTTDASVTSVSQLTVTVGPPPPTKGP